MRRLLPLLLLFGCFDSFETEGGTEPDRAELEIRLVADPGATLTAITARVFIDGDPGGTQNLRPGEDLTGGLVIGTITTTLGTHSLELQLYDAAENVVLRRNASVLVRGDQTFTFTLESSCVGVRCGPGESCMGGRCVPDPICPGPECPDCDCADDTDCPFSMGCTTFVCRDCACIPFDDDSLCPEPAFCSDGACIDACMCMTDDDCPELPPFGCGRTVCRDCACEAVPDDDGCAPGESCDPLMLVCVSGANLRVVLRTDYTPGEFTQVQTRIDGGRPILHEPDAGRDYISGVTVASTEVSFGMHEVEVSLVGVMENRFRRVDVSEDTELSVLITRPAP